MTGRPSWQRVACLVVVVSVAVALAACRESEHNRPLDFQPGVYRGEKPPKLKDEQLRELRERGNLMR